MPTIRRPFKSGNSIVAALPAHALEHIGHHGREPLWITLTTHPRLGKIIALSTPPKCPPPND